MTPGDPTWSRLQGPQLDWMRKKYLINERIMTRVLYSDDKRVKTLGDDHDFWPWVFSVEIKLSAFPAAAVQPRRLLVGSEIE